MSQEMIHYAREDTHYLLYCYDVLRAELLDKGIKTNAQNPHQFLRQVLHKSNALCLKTYEKPAVKDVNYYIKRASGLLPNKHDSSDHEVH